MKKLILKNQYVVNHDNSFYCDIHIENGIISKIVPKIAPKTQPKKFTLPGFIDSHTHGGYGFDFNDLSQDKWKNKFNTYLKEIAKEGVTKVFGTTVTCSKEDLIKIATNFNELHKIDKNQIIESWYIEGPFISKEKKGAHDENLIIPVDIDLLKKISNIYKRKKLIAVAPEFKTNNTKIKSINKDQYLICMGHSNASVQDAEKAYINGVERVVHFYNALSGFSHKTPGVVNFVFKHKNILAELICDGIHVNQYVIKNTYDILGIDNIILITDSLSCKGLKNGFYKLGTLDIEKKTDACYIKNNNCLAGAIMPFNKQLKIFRESTKCNMNDIVKITSYNHAKSLNKHNEYGCIKEGMKANLTVVDQSLNVLKTISNGIISYSKK